MSAKIFLQLGENSALGADNLQWILFQGGRPVSFVRSTKVVLVRCIREKGIEVSPAGQIALDALADDFEAWKADPATPGHPVPARPSWVAPEGDDDRSSPLRNEVTMIERLGTNVALGTDGRQWIVYRRKPGQGGIEWQGEEWRPEGFIHSDKVALERCLRIKGLELSPEGRRALHRQDVKIWRWKKAQAA